MSHEQPTPANQADPGTHAEALSREVLKLKIDDLFQEIEMLKQRVARLESQAGTEAQRSPKGVDPHLGVVSNPDSR